MTRCACGYLSRRLPCAVCAAGVAVRRVEPLSVPSLGGQAHNLHALVTRTQQRHRHAAGHPTQWTAEQLRGLLLAWAVDHDGYAPTAREVKANPAMPHPATFSKVCGAGLVALTQELGLKARPSATQLPPERRALPWRGKGMAQCLTGMGEAR